MARTGWGYLEDYGEPHPLAWKNGGVGQHRKALYDRVGIGPHPCHWCGSIVHWSGPKGIGKLYVDHLDHDRTNNRPENLVPSCMQCNVKRKAGSPDFQPGRLSAHCKRGHQLTEENLYQTKEGRRCRQCLLDHQRAYRAKRRM